MLPTTQPFSKHALDLIGAQPASSPVERGLWNEVPLSPLSGIADGSPVEQAEIEADEPALIVELGVYVFWTRGQRQFRHRYLRPSVAPNDRAVIKDNGAMDQHLDLVPTPCWRQLTPQHHQPSSIHTHDPAWEVLQKG
jgi:hypothetical protein